MSEVSISGNFIGRSLLCLTVGQQERPFLTLLLAGDGERGLSSRQARVGFGGRHSRC